jgi:hypothetical protein
MLVDVIDALPNTIFAKCYCRWLWQGNTTRVRDGAGEWGVKMLRIVCIGYVHVGAVE